MLRTLRATAAIRRVLYSATEEPTCVTAHPSGDEIKSERSATLSMRRTSRLDTNLNPVLYGNSADPKRDPTT